MSMYTPGRNDSGAGHHPRRDRLERIANAERDRRAGRTGMAIAALGEPAEWPARVVMALSKWPTADGAEARQILEEGLDLWAEDLALGSLDHFPGEAPEPTGEAPEEHGEAPETAEPTLGDLASPIEAAELDFAFETAETEVESMRDVNDVAAEILADEPVGLAELSGDVIESTDEIDAASVPMAAASVAASVAAAAELAPTGLNKTEAHTSTVLATLERWLSRLEQRRTEKRA